MAIDAFNQVKGLDLAQGISNCMDEEELFLSVVSMYIEQVIEYQPDLLNHFQQQNWEEYGKLAHSIKGASASVGLFDIQAQSATLEQAAKQQEFQIIQEQHQGYMAILESTLAQLKACL